MSGIILKLKDYSIELTHHSSNIWANPENVQKVWIRKDDGEGGEFNYNDIMNVIHEAVDKFYRENF